MNRRPQSVDTGLLFYPRGGSAQVVRYLLPTLELNFGTNTRLFVGSLGDEAAPSNASAFYRGIDVYSADYTEAVEDAAKGKDPMAAEIPLHPSYEDRPGAPDRVFCSVAPSLLDNITRYWADLLSKYNVSDADVTHLHHLTPIHGAVRAIRPDGATVTTLHGTELKMMLNAAERVSLAGKLGYCVSAVAGMLSIGDKNLWRVAAGKSLTDAELMLLRDGRWNQWVYAERWIKSLRSYADLTTRLVVISDHDQSQAVRLLGKETTDLIQVPNGVDVDRFAPRELDDDQRFGMLRRWLVEQPQGWRPGAGPGSVSYTDAELTRIRRADGTLRPIFLFVGRFLGFKRLPLLIRSFAKALVHAADAPVLMVWGGYPGEWEGQHPYDVAAEEGVGDDVYFIGWRGHDELAVGLSCADVMVAPSLNEPFGLVYLEAMSCGRPVIASASGGPLKFVTSEGRNANGWLVNEADHDGLTQALIDASADPSERQRRGTNGARMVRERYSWSVVAEMYNEIYADAFAEANVRGT